MVQVVYKMLFFVRMIWIEDVIDLIEGLSFFYIDFDWIFVDVCEIEKMGCKVVDLNEVFIDGLLILVDDLIGEEGKGFWQILYGLNFECILVVGECIGIV